MNEEILRIQKMVAEGKVTPEEAAELIESVRQAEGRNWTPPPPREPTLKSAIAEGLDAIGRWPLSKVLLLLLAVLVVALFPCAGFIAVLALVVYFRSQRRGGARAGSRGTGTSGTAGAAPGTAPAPVAAQRPARTGFGIAGLIFLALSLILPTICLVPLVVHSHAARTRARLVQPREGALEQDQPQTPTEEAHAASGGELRASVWFGPIFLALLNQVLVLPAIILGFIGWRSIPGKIAAVGGLLVDALALALPLALLITRG